MQLYATITGLTNGLPETQYNLAVVILIERLIYTLGGQVNGSCLFRYVGAVQKLLKFRLAEYQPIKQVHHLHPAFVCENVMNSLFAAQSSLQTAELQ